MKVFCADFMCLQFGFVIFWQKDFGAKAAHKMLVKDTWSPLTFKDKTENTNCGTDLSYLVQGGQPY
jgi:hypothetical protein